MESYLAAEAERLQVRRTYLPEFAKILPGRTVARFYQIENKMDAVLRYDLGGHDSRGRREARHPGTVSGAGIEPIQNFSGTNL